MCSLYLYTLCTVNSCETNLIIQILQLLSALTHIARFFYRTIFFCSRPLFITRFLSGIRDEKCCMCEWDHWNNIVANPVQYRGKFATSKLQQIRIMCVKALSIVAWHLMHFLGQLGAQVDQLLHRILHHSQILLCFVHSKHCGWWRILPGWCCRGSRITAIKLRKSAGTNTCSSWNWARTLCFLSLSLLPSLEHMCLYPT